MVRLKVLIWRLSGYLDVILGAEADTIQSLNSFIMTYYDIHTHRKAEGHVAVVNVLVRPGMDLSPEAGRFRSYGIHPRYIYDAEAQMDLLKDRVADPEAVAVGEAGFDKRSETPLALQEELFLRQAFLAEESAKPLIIHCVKAWAELIACKKRVAPESPWIIHGFRGNETLAAQLVRLGFYLSFGECFNAEALRVAWPGSIFAETDERPVDIRFVYQNMADALRVSEEELSVQIEKNISIFHLKG